MNGERCETHESAQSATSVDHKFRGCHPSPAHHSGLTLLETLLAIALGSIVFYMISVAIDLHLKTLDRRRVDVEEAQLARAVLHMIADDIRNVVLYEAEGSAGEAASSSDSSGGQSDDTSGSGSNTRDSSSDSGSTSSSSSSSSDSDSSAEDESLLFPSEPGLYGTLYDLQLDVTRPPRADQYVSYRDEDADAASIVDIASDIKSVLYYLGTKQQSRSVADDDDEPQFGLMRRWLDRAVTKWAAETGNVAGMDSATELIAHEITALEFRYTDGLEWLEEWDSSLYGLPLAVEITIELQMDYALDGSNSANRNGSGTATTSSSSARQLLSGDHVYRLTVALPTADMSTTSTLLDTTGTE